jgi:glycerol-3-phosphate cytidylyltransferase
VIRVYADMVADLFHRGHVEFLRRARELGDILVVGIHSDATVEGYKRRPIMTMRERIQVVEACRYVDEVLPDAPLVVSRRWITRHGIDIVVHGDELDQDTMMMMYKVPHDLGILRTVAYTTGVSTSDIIDRVRHSLECGESDP